MNIIFVLLAFLYLAADAGAQSSSTDVITDASQSKVTGAGLNVVTTGSTAKFTIQAMDQTNTPRTAGGDLFIVDVTGTATFSPSVVDMLDGTYVCEYTPLLSGSYVASVVLAQSGGLRGLYYENVWFFEPVARQNVDPQINFQWGNGYLTASAVDFVSIRWTGRIKTQFAEVYTFALTSDDGVKLYVDGRPIVDKWDSFTNDTLGTIALQANRLYSIKIEYKEVTNTAYMQMSWMSERTPKSIIPSTVLYYESNVYQSPFEFIVQPGAIVSTSCIANGAGLQVATAGKASQFTVNSVDQFGNSRGVGGDSFSVHIYAKNARKRPDHGSTVDNTDSSYSVEYTTFNAGEVDMSVLQVIVGGIAATYYLSAMMSPGTAIAARDSLDIKNSAVTIDYTSPGALVVTFATSRSYAVRWKGLLQPEVDQIFTFTVGKRTPFAWENVTLFLDNVEILTSGNGNLEYTGTVDLRKSFYYDIEVMYRIGIPTSTTFTGPKVTLSWESSGFRKRTLESISLFADFHIRGSPFNVRISPSSTIGGTSTTKDSGGSLSIATAGVQAAFTVTTRDRFNNLRGIGGDSFSAKLLGSKGNAFGLIQDRYDGTYRILYTAVVSGTYQLNIIVSSQHVIGSPYNVIVMPATRSLLNSPSSGASLTLVTAGVTGNVVITIKDAFDNMQASPDADNAGLTFFLQNAQISSDSPNCLLEPKRCPSNADKNHAENPRMLLRFAVTKAGTYSLMLKGTSLFDGIVKGAPFDLLVFPNLPCASQSLAYGSGLSLVTAGFSASFFVQARDQFFNKRGQFIGDKFGALLRQTPSIGSNYLDKTVDMKDNSDSTYSGAYVATRSQNNFLWAGLQLPGGLVATFYDGSARLPVGLLHMATSLILPKNGGLSAYKFTFSDTFAITWSGVIRTAVVGLYTFAVSVNHKNEKFRLWIDNQETINSIISNSNSTTLSNTFLFAKEERIHDVLLEYSSYDLSVVHKIELKWAYGGSDFSLIPTQRMFWNYHVPGSPFSVIVKPSVVCATVSTIRQMAVSLATAGKLATFTIQAQDEFNNLKETGGDAFRFGLVRSATLPDAVTRQQASDTDGRNGADDVICSLQYLFAGGYQISYTATASGVFALRGRLFQQGGLYGLYFENSNFLDNGQYNLGAGSIRSTISTFQRVDSQINFDWSVTPPVDLSAAQFAYWRGKKSIGPKYFSARWTGSILSLYTEVYSFIGRAKDGIRVVINGTVVIDAIPLRNAFAIGTMSLVADSQYPVQIDYVDYDGAASVQLSWKSKSQPEIAVPKEVLFYETTSAMLSRNGDPLKIEPAELCASTSSANGQGLSISTAGYIAKFTIQSRDQFGNLRKLGDDPVYVAKIKSEGAAQRPYDGNVRRISDRNFVGGLTATFYSGVGTNAFQSPVLVRCDIRPWDVPEFCDRTIDFSRSPGSDYIPGLLPSAFSARWSGSLTNQASGQVTFFATIASGLQERIRLTVDGQQVIESSALATSFSGQLNFKGLDLLHEIMVEYSAQTANSSAAARFSLDWKMAGFERQVIPSSRLLPLAGRYEVKYNATVKNIYNIDVNAARRGGLAATYYDDELTANPKRSFIQPSIDFSGSISTANDFVKVRTTNSSGFGDIGLSDMNSFSVRWKGFLLTTQAGVYDFKFDKGGKDERVRLWVDSMLIIDKWTPYLYENTTEVSFSATIVLDKGKYYDIEMTYSQHSNSAVARLSAQGIIISSANLFSAEPLSGSPFPGMEIIPDVGCSSSSTMRGTAVSSTTAGATSVFEIQINDKFYNQRGIGGAFLHFEVVPERTSCFGCSKSYGQIKDRLDSSYLQSYSVGRAGTYKIESYMVESGVVELTIFKNSTFSEKLSTTFMKSISFLRSSASLLPGEIGFQNLNCILKGHLNVSVPGVYSMMLSMNNFEPLNASFLIGGNAWVSNYSNASISTLESKTFTTKIMNELVPFTIMLSSNHPVNSDNQAFKILMADSANKLTEFAFLVLHSIPSDVNLLAFPDQTCASTSLANGDGLTITTAGVSSSFAITSFDSFANERGVDEDVYITRITTQSGSLLSVPELSSGVKAGRYAISYMATYSGNYFVNILRPTAGFLNASVFANEILQGIPNFSVLDDNLCVNWGLSRPVPIASSQKASDSIGIDYVSIRWVGFFAPSDSVPHTFHATTPDAFKLIIQGVVLIDKTPEDSILTTAVMSAVQRGKLYDIVMEYKHVRGAAALCIELSSTVQARQPFSKNFMYCNPINIYGSPFSAYSFPAKLCSSTTTLFGKHLSAIQTTGAHISFSIETKDEYNNHRDVWEESQSAEFNFFVRSTPASHPGTVFSGAVARNHIPGYFSGKLISTTCGQNSIYASLLTKGSIMATYYGSINTPKSISTMKNSSIICSPTTHSVLVAGAVRLPSSVIRFSLSTENASLSLNSVPVKLIYKDYKFVANSDVYEFSWLTNCSGGNSIESLQLSVSGSANSLLGIDSTIPIYYTQNLFGTNIVVQVLPDICDFLASEKFGSALSLATSGLGAVFSIQSRDRFKNKRSTGDDIFTAHVRHLSVLGSHVTSKAEYASDGKYSIQYTVTVQGAYTIDVIYGSSVIQNFMYNMPGYADGTMCVANSEFLSIATAGHNFEFSIQSKDAYRNLRTLPGENWYVSLKGSNSEQHNVKLSYMGNSHGLAYGLGKYKGSYRTTTSGSFSMSVNMVQKTGLLRIIFSDPFFTVPQQVSQVARVDVSWGTNGPLANTSLYPDYFSAKFSGFLKSDLSGVHTFFVSVADVGEAVTLKISHDVVLTSVTQQGQTEFSGTIDLMGNLLHPIELSYSETVGSASVTLNWQKGGGLKAVVPEDAFYSDPVSISGSPFKVSVFPAMVCGSLSIATGTSLSIVTAGIASTFTITSRDYMGNTRSDSSDKYVVFTRATSGFPTLNTDKIGTVIPQGNGEYAASFQADFKQNSHGCVEQTSVEACVSSEPWPSVGTATHNPGQPFHELHVQQLFRGGLMATYYADDSNALFTPKAVGILSMSNFSCSAPSAAAVLKAVSDASFLNVKIVVQGFMDVLDTFPDVTLSFQDANNKANKGKLHLDNVEIIKFPLVNTSKLNLHKKIYTVNWEVIQSKTSSSCSSILGLPKELNSSNFLSGHQLNFKISDAGTGLSSTYYSDLQFSKPLISFINGGLPFWNGTEATSRPYADILPIGDFSVRWRGFLKITKEGLYTISMNKGSVAESFKLTLDGTHLLDSDFTAASLNQSGTYFVPANYETKYDIDIAYASRASSVPKAVWMEMRLSGNNASIINAASTEPRLVSYHVSRNDELVFDWKNGCTGLVGSSSRMKCRGRGTRFNQFLAIQVLPNVAVSAFSSSSGRQLTISTAGIHNYFTVTLRDKFKNQIDDDTIVSAFIKKTGNSDIVEIAGVKSQNDRGPGLLATYYNDFRSTNQMMLTSSYYNSPYIFPIGGQYTKKQANFAFVANSSSYSDNKMDFDGHFAVSMRGFVRAPSSGGFALEYVCEHSACQDVFVWIDDSLVLTRSVAKLPMFQMVRHSFYEIRVLYMSTRGIADIHAFSLRFNCGFVGCINISTQDIFPHANDNYKKSPTGQHQGQFRLERSGFYDMSVALASPIPGVRACFFANPNMTSLVRCTLWNEVGFDLSNSSPIDAIAHDNVQWSASIEGWYKPGESENVTFFVESNSFFEMRFDEKNCSSPCSMYMDTMKQYYFKANIYPVQICTSHPCTWIQISTFKIFQRTSAGVVKTLLPDRFKSDLEYISVTPLHVFPARACASTSSVHGTCLSLVTAGISSTMTLQIRDEFLNLRTQENDVNYAIEVSVKRFPVSREPSAFANCMPSGESMGKHLCSYTITRAQASLIDVYLNFESGLEATYYDDSNFLSAKASYRQHDVSSLQGSSAPPVLTNDGKWSANFEGSIRSPRSSNISFAIDCENDEWASVAIDDMSLLNTKDGIRAGSMKMQAEKFYKIFIRYSSSGNASWFFSFRADIEGASNFGYVPKHRLYASRRLKGSPFTSEVRSAVACSSTSLSNGMGITLSTAGFAATFKITTRDEFSNIRSLSCLKCHDIFYVRLMACGRVPSSSFSEYPFIVCPNCINCPILVRSANSNTTNSAVYEISYTPTKTGNYRAMVSLANDPGISTSFFDNKSKFCANQIDCDTGDQKFVSNNIDFSASGSMAGRALSSFAFRWRGLIRSNAASDYTFSISNVNASVTSVTLWIDNQIVLSSSTLAQKSIGTISLHQEFGLYDFQLIYVAELPSTSAGLTLKWKSDQSNFDVVPASNFVQRQDIPIKALHLVQPALQSPKASFAFGSGLTIATSGTRSFFTVASRDQFQNKRLTVNIDEISSEIRGSVGFIHSNVVVTFLSENTVKVAYTVSKASAFDLVVRQFGAAIFESPFSLIVAPSIECASKSFAIGSGLSWSLVNSLATFKVQLRDAFGNVKSSRMSSSGSCQAVVTVNSLLADTGEVDTVTLSNADAALCKNVAVMFFGGTLYENAQHAEAVFDSDGVFRFLGKGKYVQRNLPFALKGKAMNSELISKISYTSNGPIFETSGAPTAQVAANSITIIDQMQKGVHALQLQPSTSPGQYFLSYKLTSKPTPPMKAFMLPYLVNKGGLIATYFTLSNLISSQNFNDLLQATPCYVTFVEQSLSNVPAACGSSGPFGVRYFGFASFAAAAAPAIVSFTIPASTTSYVRMFWRSTPADLKTSGGVSLGNTWTSLPSVADSTFSAQLSWSSARTAGYDDFVVEIRSDTLVVDHNGFPTTNPSTTIHAPWPLASWPSPLTVLDETEEYAGQLAGAKFVP